MKAGSEAGFPKFHKKRDESSFMVVPGKSTPMRLSGTRFQIPKIGFVKTQSKLRWPGATQTYGRVKRVAGRWWLTLSYELPDPPKLPDGRPACGIDLGISRLATIASGGRVVEEVKSPSPYMKAQEQLRQAKRRANRKSRGSANQRKALLKLAKLHERVASVRGNFLHQLTNRLVNRFGVICLEDLRVGELAGKGLGKLIHDMGWGIIRRQIEYKAETAGTKVVFADRFYPSSKTCSTCGQVKTKLALAERNWTCEGCGTSHNRDVNAAINLEKLGRGTPEETPAETRSTPKRKLSCSRSRKQETPCSQERQAGEMPTSGLPPMTPTP
jgi:putative transposase